MGAMPSWNAVIVLVYVIGIGYNLLLHRNNATGHIAAGYVSLAVTPTIASYFYGIATGQKMILGQLWVKGNVTPQTIESLTFIILTIVLSSFLIIIPSGRKADNLDLWEIILFSFIWVTFLISTVLSYLPAEELTSLTSQAQFINVIWSYHNLWLLLPAFAILFAGFRRGN